jgi:hypothetical protein
MSGVVTSLQLLDCMEAVYLEHVPEQAPLREVMKQDIQAIRDVLALYEGGDTFRHFNIKDYEPEIAAMSIILETLKDMDTDTASRILNYVMSRRGL